MSPRERALVKAVGVLQRVAHPMKEPALDLLIGLAGMEAAARRGEPAMREVRDGAGNVIDVVDLVRQRKLVSTELVRMKLPEEVLAALRGA